MPPAWNVRRLDQATLHGAMGRRRGAESSLSGSVIPPPPPFEPLAVLTCTGFVLMAFNLWRLKDSSKVAAVALPLSMRCVDITISILRRSMVRLGVLHGQRDDHGCCDR